MKSKSFVFLAICAVLVFTACSKKEPSRKKELSETQKIILEAQNMSLEELAKKAVAKMKNVDGTCGEHWTYEQTSQLADQQGIRCKADWYYVMNMLHSDFAEILGSDTNNYVRMAKAYINDPDASEGKVLDAWLAQML